MALHGHLCTPRLAHFPGPPAPHGRGSGHESLPPLAYRKAALLAVQRVREIAMPVNRSDETKFRDVLDVQVWKNMAFFMNSKLIAHYKYVALAYVQ